MIGLGGDNWIYVVKFCVYQVYLAMFGTFLLQEQFSLRVKVYSRLAFFHPYDGITWCLCQNAFHFKSVPGLLNCMKTQVGRFDTISTEC